MNERIEILAEESGMTQYVAPHNKYLERFTMMVIRDCLDKIQEVENMVEDVVSHDTGFYDGLEVAKIVIRRHFGIAEGSGI